MAQPTYNQSKVAGPLTTDTYNVNIIAKYLCSMKLPQNTNFP